MEVSVNLTVLGMEQRMFDNKTFWKCKVLTEDNDYYEVNVANDLVKNRPEVINLKGKSVLAKLGFAQGKYNAPTVILRDVEV